jgi:hypothetical protein
MKRSDWVILRSTIADELASCAKIKLVWSSRKSSQAVNFVAERSFWSQTYCNDIAAPDPLPGRCRRPVSVRSAIRRSQLCRKQKSRQWIPNKTLLLTLYLCLDFLQLGLGIRCSVQNFGFQITWIYLDFSFIVQTDQLNSGMSVLTDQSKIFALRKI